MVSLDKFPFRQINGHILRRITSYDAQAYYRYMNHDAVKAFISDGLVPSSLDDSRGFMDYYSNYLNRAVFWGIADEKTDLLIGTIGFNFISTLHKKAEISFDLDHDYWGKKIMKQAIEKVLDFAKTIDLVRVQASVLSGNTKCISLLEKNGFKKEGVLEKYESNQKNQDSLMYALILK